VRDGAGGAGAGEGVENPIFRLGGDLKYCPKEAFRLGRAKEVRYRPIRKQVLLPVPLPQLVTGAVTAR
jgi:hypothetical protein